jgi:hypothetical protein
MRWWSAFALALACCSPSSSPSPDGGATTGGGIFGGKGDASADSIGAKANDVLSGCAGGPESACHSSNAGNMHLPDVPPNLVNVPSYEEPTLVRVMPGNPEQSYLYMKVVNDPRIMGARMPSNGPALASADVETLRSWIEAGAPSP